MYEGTYIDEERAKKLYLEEQLSCKDIAKILECSAPTIAKRLVKNGVIIRTAKEQKAIDFEKKRVRKEVVIRDMYSNKVPIDCNKKGKKCAYRAVQTGNIYYAGTCDYILIIGCSRKCPACMCTAYEFGPRKKAGNFGRSLDDWEV